MSNLENKYYCKTVIANFLLNARISSDKQPYKTRVRVVINLITINGIDNLIGNLSIWKESL